MEDLRVEETRRRKAQFIRRYAASLRHPKADRRAVLRTMRRDLQGELLTAQQG